MGGMTIMALAGGHPELFGGKVVGAVLIATAASGLSGPDGLVPWLPPPFRSLLQRAAPAVLRGASAGPPPWWSAAGRRRGNWSWWPPGILAFGDPQASMALTEFVERMIREAPVGVIAEFYGALLGCDLRDGLGALGRVPVTVVTGERDRLVPARLGAELAAEIPGAQLVMVPGAGHVPMLERPDIVNDAITSLVGEVEPGADSAASPGGPRRGRRAGRCLSDRAGALPEEITPEESVQEITVPTAAAMRALGRASRRCCAPGTCAARRAARGGQDHPGAGPGRGAAGARPGHLADVRHRPGASAAGRRPGLVHVDAYRLGGLAEMDDLDLDLDGSVTVVEWGRAWPRGFPPTAWRSRSASRRWAGPDGPPRRPGPSTSRAWCGSAGPVRAGRLPERDGPGGA